MLGRNSLLEGGEALAWVTQRICRQPILELFKARLDGLEQPGLVRGVLVHGRALDTDELKIHFNQSVSMILWSCPHVQRCCSRSIFCPPQQPFPHKPSTCCAPSNTPHSIAVLLRKNKLEIWCPALEEPLGDFQMSLGNFYPAQKYQTEELCSTAASLPDSSGQGWQTPDSCWKQESPPRHLQPAYSCCSSFEGNLSL